MIDENNLSLAIDEREKLGRAAYAAYVATGADTDGARNWRELFRPLVHPSWADVLRSEIEESIETEQDVIEAVLRLHATDHEGFCAECRRLVEYGGTRGLENPEHLDKTLRWPCPTAVAAGELRLVLQDH